MNLRDIPHLLRDTFQQWREEDITRLGAALAYYAAFSLIPLLMVTAILYSTLIGTQEAESRIGQVVNQFIGEQAAQTIREMVSNVNGGHIPLSITTLVSVGALLYGATGLFRHLKDSLNVVWSVPPATPNKVKGFLKDTALSLLMVMGFGLLLLVVLLVNTVLFQFVRSQGGVQSDAQLFPFGQALGFGLLLVFTVLTFATIYKTLPDAHVHWHDVWMGATVTAVLFTFGQVVIGFVLNQSTLDTLYGTASALVFILIWVHISAHIVLFGAEFTQVYANHYGSKIVPADDYNHERAEQT